MRENANVVAPRPCLHNGIVSQGFFRNPPQEISWALGVHEFRPQHFDGRQLFQQLPGGIRRRDYNRLQAATPLPCERMQKMRDHIDTA